MTVAFYMNCVSTHQLPLAKEVAAIVGAENFVYVDAGLGGQKNQTIGAAQAGVRILNLKDDPSSVRLELETSTLVYTGLRDLELLAKRAAKGLATCYYSERWFKPILVGSGKWVVGSLPGWVRMLVPSYRKMAKRFVKWANEDPRARVLAVGPWAKRDFLRMGVRADKLVPWGYFVEPSRFGTQVADATRKVGQDLNAYAPQIGFPSGLASLGGYPRNTADGISTSCPVVSPKQLKVLWVGRDLAWKRVKDIERAVTLANKKLISALQLQLQSTTQPITFTKLTGVTPSEVRAAMRSHDLYILASNAEEGWGAALNEALEEGMSAIGTFEAGASAAMLPRARLYHAGDVGALARLLESEYLTFTGRCTKHEARSTTLPPCSIGEWTAKKAAQRLVNLI